MKKPIQSRQVFVAFVVMAIVGCGEDSSDEGVIATAPPGPIEMVSLTSSDGQTLAGDNNYRAAVSADGSYVAFESQDNNLTRLAAPPSYLYVRDARAATTDGVSVDSYGVLANDTSGDVSISADGRYVAFSSLATNLVADDNNGVQDVFVHDRQTGDTTRVSVGTSGVQADGASYYPVISADGRYVAFDSAATNLVAGDDNGFRDIFVHARQTGQTDRVSISNSLGIQGNGGSYAPAISSDGRFVVFESGATNLVVGDLNAANDIFVHDRQAGGTTRVSVDSSGTEANGYSSYPAISADGRYVAFESFARNLVGDDSNTRSDIFVHDRDSGATVRVSVDSSGGQADDDSRYPAISANGRYVVYESIATDLVADDTNLVRDVFVYDITTGGTARVSVDASSNEANATSHNVAISADGRYVVFDSRATNLVLTDSNDASDVFRAPNPLWSSP